MSRSNDTARGWRFLLGECGGACGDLGTFIPHVIGAIAVAGLAPFGVLFGFAVFLIGTGLFYGLPLPVQPMKAVSAVILTDGLLPGEVAASGMILGATLLILGATGLNQPVRASDTAIGRCRVATRARAADGNSWGKANSRNAVDRRFSLILLVLLSRIPHCPAAPVTLVAAICAGWLGGASLPATPTFAWPAPEFVVPSWPEVWRSIEIAVLPQLSLTLTNAVIVTAALMRELFPVLGAAASERRLALSSGLANVLLCPFGAMPMCHGAGGLQAQYRFGARTGLAPILFGAALLVLAIGFADSAASLFAIVPAGAVGALLIFAGIDLAASPRLFDAKPSCWPVIAAATAATVLVNPGLGLLVGWAAELARAAIMRRFRSAFRSEAQPGPAAPILDGARLLRGKYGKLVASGGN